MAQTLSSAARTVRFMEALGTYSAAQLATARADLAAHVAHYRARGFSDADIDDMSRDSA